MSPDLYFVLSLIVKMVVTAAFLLAATITAERAGPLIGGLVATLPISAGPVYIFLALDHDAHFIAQSALGSLVTNAYNTIFAVVYALLAQSHSLVVSFNIVVIGLALWISAPLRHVPMPRVQRRWYDFVLRAAMVALLVGTVVTLSFRIGPTASGSLAVFPIVLSSMMFILHYRVGGPATAAVMANAVIGLGGFAVAVLALNLTAERLGSALALSLALLVSVCGNLLIYFVRRRMAKPMAKS